MKSILTANVMRNKEAKYDERHGGPYDRGAADSWYYRSRNPHWIDHKNGGNRFKQTDMTPKEIAEYHAGYDDNEEAGAHKDYGH